MKNNLTSINQKESAFDTIYLTSYRNPKRKLKKYNNHDKNNCFSGDLLTD